MMEWTKTSTIQGHDKLRTLQKKTFIKLLTLTIVVNEVAHTGLKVSEEQTGKEPLLVTPREFQYAPQNDLSHPEPTRKNKRKFYDILIE